MHIYKHKTKVIYIPFLADLISRRLILSILSLWITIVSFAGYLNRVSLMRNVHSMIFNRSSSLIVLCPLMRAIPQPKTGVDTLCWAYTLFTLSQKLIKNSRYSGIVITALLLLSNFVKAASRNSLYTQMVPI